MANSETNICNLALSEIGNYRITGLDDQSEEGIVCRLLYPVTRDEVIASPAIEWNIATGRAQLTEHADTPAFAWARQFQIPADPKILRVIAMVDSNDNSKTIPWAREGNLILTDDSTCYIKYIKQVTDPTQFPPLLYEAIYTNLASKLAVKIAKNPTLRRELLLRYVNDVLPRAQEANAAESYQEGEEGNEDWIETGR
tara:strand:+ start:274 stop:867 length:594 start_codon:yes stop_codon:yes gene_type:complete